MSGHTKLNDAQILQSELANAPNLLETLIQTSTPLASQIGHDWINANAFVFCGAGPSYGSALFSAAKILEASGDHAIGQELEEWAHLEYFGREANTPTFIISGGLRDEDRTLEIVAAARAIGRRVALIAPETSPLSQLESEATFQLPGPINEAFTPLISCIPGMLFAAYRSQIMDEPYFRGFGGGRSHEGGGGISRIRTSKQIEQFHN